MLLFFSPVLNLLSESRKQSRLVFWGVELIPTPDANKSLQVSGDFHAQLLSYIKHYIDEAIAEMEASETAPQTEEIESPYSSETEIARLNEAVDKKATQSEPKTNSSSSEKIETDGVKSVETESTPQKPEIVNTEAVEVVETDETEDTEVVETDETDDDIENWPTPSVEATDNNSKELNEEPTALEMAGNTFTGLVSTPKLLSGSENGNPPDSEPSKPSVAETIINHLKQIDSKLSFQTEGDIINVNLDEQEIGYIDCSDFSVATILDEKLHKDYFFDICSYLGDVEVGEVQQVEDHYIVGHAPKQPESTVSEPSQAVQAGDIIEVHTASALNGKTVEVNYVKPDGTVNVVWDNKNYDVPASDYKIFSKGLGLKKI